MLSVCIYIFSYSFTFNTSLFLINSIYWAWLFFSLTMIYIIGFKYTTLLFSIFLIFKMCSFFLALFWENQAFFIFNFTSLLAFYVYLFVSVNVYAGAFSSYSIIESICILITVHLQIIVYFFMHLKQFNSSFCADYVSFSLHML